MIYDAETGAYIENDSEDGFIPNEKPEPSLEDRVSALEDVMLENILGGSENV